MSTDVKALFKRDWENIEKTAVSEFRNHPLMLSMAQLCATAERGHQRMIEVNMKFKPMWTWLYFALAMANAASAAAAFAVERYWQGWVSIGVGSFLVWCMVYFNREMKSQEAKVAESGRVIAAWEQLGKPDPMYPAWPAE